MTRPPAMEDLLADAELKVAIAHHQAGRIAEARTHYAAVLALRPDTPLALCNLAVIALDEGLAEQSETLLRKAVTLAPAYAPARANLGLALRRLGRDDEALDALSTAVRLAPDDATGHYNLGTLFRDLERFKEALPCYRAAVSLAPADPVFLAALGLALWNVGRFAESAAVFERTCALAPDLVEAHLGLASAWCSLGRFPEALARCQRAIAMAPGRADGYVSLGTVLRGQYRRTEAEAAFRRAVELDPESATAHCNLADMLEELRRPEDAVKSYARAAALKPDLTVARARLAHQRQIICDWEAFDEDQRWLLSIVREGKEGTSPFSLLSMDSTPADQMACARMHTRKMTSVQDAPLWSPHAQRQKGRLRIGYISCDFHEHPVCHLIAEMLERHDRSRFEITGYSYGLPSDQELRRRVAGAMEHFIDIRDLSFDAAAKRIQDDGIDILVDLTGYTGRARSQIVALRPAPVTVSFLGYPGTMAADFIDYIIVDPYLAPMEDQPFYTERIVQLPDCYQPGDTKRRAVETSRESCGLPGDGLVLVSFNNYNKFTPELFGIWMRVLKAAPGAVLWLRGSNRATVENLKREAAARDVDPLRLVFAERAPFDEYLGRLALADLFLDCYPYNAGATANDALWMGLPVLTRSGATYVSRMAGSLLSTLGLPELITHSAEEYEALAIELVTRPERLAALRTKLAAAREDSPLFDIARYTRNIEAAYRRMWEIHEAKEEPHPFAVTP